MATSKKNGDGKRAKANPKDKAEAELEAESDAELDAELEADAKSDSKLEALRVLDALRAKLEEEELGGKQGRNRKHRKHRPDEFTEDLIETDSHLLNSLAQMLEGLGHKHHDKHDHGGGYDDIAGSAIAAIMGSGPAFAALESMLAGSTSQSSMLMNAAKNQRQLDQVALCTTSACVRQILSMNNNFDNFE